RPGLPRLRPAVRLPGRGERLHLPKPALRDGLRPGLVPRPVGQFRAEVAVVFDFVARWPRIKSLHVVMRQHLERGDGPWTPLWYGPCGPTNIGSCTVSSASAPTPLISATPASTCCRAAACATAQSPPGP